MSAPLSSPLAGIRIVEFEGIGPGPLAARMLADMGAEVTVIARPQQGAVAAQLGGSGDNPLRRGKTVVLLDLKQDAARAEALALVAQADALIEGNRPGVMERLKLGPHDLNYVALTGMLSLSAHRGERPIVPPTVVGDAGGALGLAFGMVCAILEAKTSGQGRVVDAAIVDIVAMLGGIAQWIRGSGQLDGSHPSPFHDSPFYDVYRCADGGSITLGALEPQFYALLLQKLGLGDVDLKRQFDPRTWPALKDRLTALFASQPRAHWDALLEGTDVCFAPVLSVAQAAEHPHNVARGTYVRTAGAGFDVAPAPRFLPLDGKAG